MPKQLFADSYLNANTAGFNGRTYDVSLDDRRFLMIKEQDASASQSPGPSRVVVEHWTEELKKLAK